MTGGAVYPLQIRRRSAAYLRDKSPALSVTMTDKENPISWGFGPNQTPVGAFLSVIRKHTPDRKQGREKRTRPLLPCPLDGCFID